MKATERWRKKKGKGHLWECLKKTTYLKLGAPQLLGEMGGIFFDSFKKALLSVTEKKVRVARPPIKNPRG